MGNFKWWGAMVVSGLWVGGCNVEFCEDDFETKVAVSSGTYTDPQGKEVLLGGRVSVTFPHAQLVDKDCLEDSEPIGAGGESGAGLGGAMHSEGGVNGEDDRLCTELLNSTTLTFDRKSGNVERVFHDSSGAEIREVWASDATSEVETDLLGCYPVETETLVLTIKSVKRDNKEVAIPTANESFDVRLEWLIEGDQEGALLTARNRQRTDSDPVYVYTEWYPAK